MPCLKEIKEEIKKYHPELKIDDNCILGLIEILKKQCPKFNKVTQNCKV